LVKVHQSGSRRRDTESRWFSDLGWVMLRAAFTAVVAAVYYVAAVVGSSWFADDFLYLQLARRGSLTPSWLAVDNYGHFAPLTRMAYLFVQRVGGLDYHFAAIVPVAFSTAAAFGLISLLGEISGRRPRTIALAAAGSLSVFVMRVVLWYGAGVHVMGALAAELFCMWCFVVYLRTRHRRWLVGSWIALVVGLLVQERPVLTIGVLLLLRYVGLRRGPAVRGLARELRSDLPMWAGYAAITSGYLAYRLFVFSSKPRPGGVGDVLDLAVYGIVNNLLPGSLGARVHLQPGRVDQPLVLSGVVLASVVTAVVAFVFVSWSRRESWRPWAFYAPCLLANLAIFVLGRLGGTNGQGNAIAYAYDQQYFVDAHVLLVVTLAIALSLPRRPAWQRAAPRARGMARAVVGATATFVLVSTLVSWKAMVDYSAALPSKGYIEQAVADLRQETSEEPVDLIELTLPTEVNPFYINGYDDVPGVIGVDAGLRRRLDVSSTHKVAVTSTGRVGRVAPVELVRLTPQQLATADVSGGAAIAVTDGRACLTAPDGGAVSLRLTKPVEANGLFMSIEYQSTTPASVLPVVTDGGALNFNWSPATLAAGRDARVLRVRHDLADGVALVFPDGVDNLCLDGLALLEVALLEPVPVAGAPSGVRCPVLDGSGHITQTLVRCDGRWR
jgi:hypothetical protein